MKTKKLKDTSNDFLSFFEEKGYFKEVNKSLKSPVKDLFFTICGGVFYEDYFKGTKIPPQSLKKLTRVQYCLRRDNNHKIGISYKHLTFFKMLELFNFHATDLNLFIDALDFLKLKIDSNKLLINVPLKSPLRDIIESTNFKINYLSNKNLSWYLKGGLLRGDRIEINYEMDNDLCELWNMSYIYKQSEKTILNNNHRLIDSGMCLERLNMAINGYSSVFECDELNDIKNHIKKFVDFDDILLNYISDQIRTLKELFQENILPGPKKINGEVRKILKNVLVRLKINNENLLVIKDILGDYSFLQNEVEVFLKNYQHSIKFLEKNLTKKTYDISLIKYLKVNHSIQELITINWLLNNNIKIKVDKDINKEKISKKYKIHMYDLEKIIKYNNEDEYEF